MYEEDIFDIGVRLFVDRNYVAVEAPTEYIGLPMIRTAMDDKSLPLGNHNMSFAVNRPVRVHLMASTTRLGDGFDVFEPNDVQRWRLKGNTTYRPSVAEIKQPGVMTIPIPIEGRRRPTMYFLLIEPLSHQSIDGADRRINMRRIGGEGMDNKALRYGPLREE